MSNPDQFLSDLDLAARYAINRVTIWRWLTAKPDFPRPVALSERVRRWRLSEVEAWEASRERIEGQAVAAE